MSEVAIPEPDMLVLSTTGEIVLRDDLAACAAALREIRGHETQLKDEKRWLTQVFQDESARVGKKTLHFAGMEVVLSGGDETEWDVTELLKLLDLGLPEKRYAELVQEVVTHKVNAAVAKQIAGSNPEYAKVIEAAKVVHEKPVRASVA